MITATQNVAAPVVAPIPYTQANYVAQAGTWTVDAVDQVIYRRVGFAGSYTRYVVKLDNTVIASATPTFLLIFTPDNIILDNATMGFSNENGNEGHVLVGGLGGTQAIVIAPLNGTGVFPIGPLFLSFELSVFI